MIVIVDDRSEVAATYLPPFDKAGFAVSGIGSQDFFEWLSTAADDDVAAIAAVLVGEGSPAGKLAGMIKRRSAAAIIALRETESLAGTLDLFDQGVDDVVDRPCDVREILARIEAIGRRGRAGIAGAEPPSAIRTFRDGRDALVGGAPLPLPRRELRILEFLAANQPRRVTKSQIFNAVYGLFDQDVGEAVIECHISRLRGRLRRRLGYDPIESQRHLGYRLTCR